LTALFLLFAGGAAASAVYKSTNQIE